MAILSGKARRENNKIEEFQKSVFTSHFSSPFLAYQSMRCLTFERTFYKQRENFKYTIVNEIGWSGFYVCGSQLGEVLYILQF